MEEEELLQKETGDLYKHLPVALMCVRYIIHLETPHTVGMSPSWEAENCHPNIHNDILSSLHHTIQSFRPIKLQTVSRMQPLLSNSQLPVTRQLPTEDVFPQDCLSNRPWQSILKIRSHG